MKYEIESKNTRSYYIIINTVINLCWIVNAVLFI